MDLAIILTGGLLVSAVAHADEQVATVHWYRASTEPLTNQAVRFTAPIPAGAYASVAAINDLYVAGSDGKTYPVQIEEVATRPDGSMVIEVVYQRNAVPTGETVDVLMKASGPLTPPAFVVHPKVEQLIHNPLFNGGIAVFIRDVFGHVYEMDMLPNLRTLTKGADPTNQPVEIGGMFHGPLLYQPTLSPQKVDGPPLPHLFEVRAYFSAFSGLPYLLGKLVVMNGSLKQDVVGNMYYTDIHVCAAGMIPFIADEDKTMAGKVFLLGGTASVGSVYCLPLVRANTDGKAHYLRDMAGLIFDIGFAPPPPNGLTAGGNALKNPIVGVATTGPYSGQTQHWFGPTRLRIPTAPPPGITYTSAISKAVGFVDKWNASPDHKQLGPPHVYFQAYASGVGGTALGDIHSASVIFSMAADARVLRTLLQRNQWMLQRMQTFLYTLDGAPFHYRDYDFVNTKGGTSNDAIISGDMLDAGESGDHFGRKTPNPVAQAHRDYVESHGLEPAYKAELEGEPPFPVAYSNPDLQHKGRQVAHEPVYWMNGAFERDIAKLFGEYARAEMTELPTNASGTQGAQWNSVWKRGINRLATYGPGVGYGTGGQRATGWGNLWKAVGFDLASNDPVARADYRASALAYVDVLNQLRIQSGANTSPWINQGSKLLGGDVCGTQTWENTLASIGLRALRQGMFSGTGAEDVSTRETIDTITVANAAFTGGMGWNAASQGTVVGNPYSQVALAPLSTECTTPAYSAFLLGEANTATKNYYPGHMIEWFQLTGDTIWIDRAIALAGMNPFSPTPTTFYNDMFKDGKPEFHIQLLDYLINGSE